MHLWIWILQYRSALFFCSNYISNHCLSLSSNISSCSFGTLPPQSLCISKGTVYKIAKDVYQFTVVPVLKSFQVKSLSFVSGHSHTAHNATHLHIRWNPLHIHWSIRPSSCLLKLFLLQYSEFVCRNIIGQYKIAVSFQHWRENDAMKTILSFPMKWTSLVSSLHQ